VGVYEINSSTTTNISNQSIRENIVDGVIGNLTMINGQQLSPNTTISFTLGGNDADKFEITSENILELKSGTIANFENQSSYNITITLTFNLGSGIQTVGTAKELIISVTDVEENTITGDFRNNSIETITGTNIDDHIDSNGGFDEIDGNDGNDTLLLFADRSKFEVVTLAGVSQIKGLNGSSNYEGYYIRMVDVENVLFSDEAIALDTELNDANYILGDFRNNSIETITGTSGDDVIDSYGGFDEIDGNDGNDTLLLFADRSKFEITILNDTVKIKGVNGSGNYEGYTITLSNVETIMFADQTIQVSELSSSSSQLIPGTVDNNTLDPALPITPDGDDNPYPIILPGEISLWAEEYDLGLIELPLAAIDSAPLLVDGETSLEDLVMIEESMELDFTLFSENLEPLDTVPVKPISEPTSDPYVESYYQDVLEDWHSKAMVRRCL